MKPSPSQTPIDLSGLAAWVPSSPTGREPSFMGTNRNGETRFDREWSANDVARWDAADAVEDVARPLTALAHDLRYGDRDAFDRQIRDAMRECARRLNESVYRPDLRVRALAEPLPPPTFPARVGAWFCEARWRIARAWETLTTGRWGDETDWD